MNKRINDDDDEDDFNNDDNIVRVCDTLAEVLKISLAAER